MRSAVILLLLVSFAFPSFGQRVPTDKPDFKYLDISGNVVRTSHSAKYRISVSRSFKFLGVLDHQAVYNEIGFNVSMAVFARGNDLLLIHAEKHTDGSGGLDYGYLKPARLSGIPFNARTQCATAEDRAELDENPQIRFIRSKGFDLTVPFQLEQFFATSQDGTSEVVISYGRAVEACSDVTGEELRKDLESVVSVAKLELDPESDAYYLRVEIPLKGDCEVRLSAKGLVTDSEYCSFGDKLLLRDSIVVVNRSVERRGWVRLEIKHSNGDETTSLFLSSEDIGTFETLFNVFFTKRFDEVRYDSSCRGLKTPLDIIRLLGFPNEISRQGTGENWLYGVDRPVNCMDLTVFLLERGTIVSISGSV